PARHRPARSSRTRADARRCCQPRSAQSPNRPSAAPAPTPPAPRPRRERAAKREGRGNGSSATPEDEALVLRLREAASKRGAAPVGETSTGLDQRPTAWLATPRSHVNGFE